MKKPLVIVLILTSFGIGVTPSQAAPRRCRTAVVNAYAQTQVPLTPASARYPAPVAELNTGRGPTYEGMLLRVATAPTPAQMINPAAPALYGSGRSLVSYSESTMHRGANMNVREVYSDGLRLWSLRDIW
ncbi:MAG: hypothetical protein ACFUZC_00965 [Chthoniobacteraceae bacterium]